MIDLLIWLLMATGLFLLVAGLHMVREALADRRWGKAAEARLDAAAKARTDVVWGDNVGPLRQGQPVYKAADGKWYPVA